MIKKIYYNKLYLNLINSDFYKKFLKINTYLNVKVKSLFIVINIAILFGLIASIYFSQKKINIFKIKIKLLH